MFKKGMIILLVLLVMYMVLPGLFFLIINIPIYLALAVAIIISSIASVV